MDATLIRQVLLDLERYGSAHDAQETDHARKLLNLEPETAHFIHILARSSHFQIHILYNQDLG